MGKDRISLAEIAMDIIEDQANMSEAPSPKELRKEELHKVVTDHIRKLEVSGAYGVMNQVSEVSHILKPPHIGLVQATNTWILPVDANIPRRMTYYEYRGGTPVEYKPEDFGENLFNQAVDYPGVITQSRLPNLALSAQILIAPWRTLTCVYFGNQMRIFTARTHTDENYSFGLWFSAEEKPIILDIPSTDEARLEWLLPDKRQKRKNDQQDSFRLKVARGLVKSCSEEIQEKIAKGD